MLREMAQRYRVIWVINSVCASRCSYCSIELQRHLETLTATEVARVAREILAAGFREVIFVGGEPLLLPHLAAALDVLRGSLSVALFTGGIPGDLRRSLDLVGMGVDRLVLSIDAGDDETNDRLRGRRGTTRDIVRLIEGVRREHPRVGLSVNTVVTRFNVAALDGVWERIRPWGVQSWSLTLAGDNFGGSPAGHFLERAQIEQLYLRAAPALAARLARDRCELVVLPVPLPFLEAELAPHRWGAEANRWRARLDGEFDRYARGYYNESFVERHGCPLVGVDVTIGVGGEVHPCSQAPIIQPAYVVGRLRSARLADVLDGAEIGAFGAGVPHEICRRCWAPSNIERPVLRSLLRAGSRPS